jgi:hypothetical protein
MRGNLPVSSHRGVGKADPAITFGVPAPQAWEGPALFPAVGTAD